jgi:hypothetical protein
VYMMYQDVDYIYAATGRGQWQAVLSMGMNVRIFATSWVTVRILSTVTHEADQPYVGRKALVISSGCRISVTW